MFKPQRYFYKPVGHKGWNVFVDIGGKKTPLDHSVTGVLDTEQDCINFIDAAIMRGKIMYERSLIDYIEYPAPTLKLVNSDA